MIRLKRYVPIFVIGLLISSFNTHKVTWVAIGDSITYLNEHADETGGRITKGYMTRVVEKLPYLSYINQGHNGWTSGNIANEIDHLGLTKADVYSIFLGTNDWWQGRPIGNLTDYLNNTGNETFYGSFRIIINKIKKINPTAKIILITPMQRADFVFIGDMHTNAYGSYKDRNGQSLASFANAIDSIALQEKFISVDLYNNSGMNLQNLVKYKRLKNPLTGVYTNYSYPECTSIPLNPDTDEYPYPTDAIDMTYDGLHPSDKGYSVIANMLIKVLK